MLGRHVNGETVSVLVGEAAHQASQPVAGEGTVGLYVVLQGVALPKHLATYPTLPRPVAKCYDVIYTVVILVIVKHA